MATAYDPTNAWPINVYPVGDSDAPLEVEARAMTEEQVRDRFGGSHFLTYPERDIAAHYERAAMFARCLTGRYTGQPDFDRVVEALGFSGGIDLWR